MPDQAKRWPSPDDLLKALIEAKQRFGCRELERIDALADGDTGAFEVTKVLLSRVFHQANSKKQEE